MVKYETNPTLALTLALTLTLTRLFPQVHGGPRSGMGREG